MTGGALAIAAVLGTLAASPPLRAPPAELTAGPVTVSHGVRFTRYAQTRDGLPVLGADAVVADAPGTRADLVLDRTRRDVPAPPAPRVTRAAAVDTAVAGRRLSSPARASLALLGDGRLVWRVRVFTREPFTGTEVLVDAHSGEVAGTRPLVWSFFGAARLFDPSPVVEFGAPLDDDGGADNPLLASLRLPVTLPRLTDVDGCLAGEWARARLYDKPAVDVCLTDRDFSEIGRDDDRFEAAMAYFHIDRAQALVQQLGFPNVLDRQLVIKADAIPDDNSFYDTTTGEITLGTGGVDDGEDADVILHEYGHAILDAQAPGLFAGDGAAISEGFADYFQGAISDLTGHPGEAAACVAEWDSTSFGLKCLRRLDTTLTLAAARADPGCSAEPHCLGQVWSGALWQLRGQLGTTADQIVLQSNFALPTAPSFSDAARALLAADRQLTGGANRAQLITTLMARGLIDAERTDDTPSEAVALSVPGTATGHLDAAADPHDVYRLALTAGGGIVVRLTASTGNFGLRLLRPGTRSVDEDGAIVAGSTTPGAEVHFSYVPAQTGEYSLDLAAAAGAGGYTLAVLLDRDGDTVPTPRTTARRPPTTARRTATETASGTPATASPAIVSTTPTTTDVGRTKTTARRARTATRPTGTATATATPATAAAACGWSACTPAATWSAVTARLRPAALPAAALRVELRQGRRLRVFAGARRVHGRATLTIRGLRPGRYTLRGRLRADGYAPAVTPWRSLRVR